MKKAISVLALLALLLLTACSKSSDIKNGKVKSVKVSVVSTSHDDSSFFKSVVEAAANDISQVYINANKRDEKNRALTVDEQARVSSNMKVIFESEADALKITGDKKNTLMKALNGEFNNMRLSLIHH